MKEGRKELVDFEMRLYTFLRKVFIPYTQVQIQHFTGQKSTGWHLPITHFMSLTDLSNAFELNEKLRLDFPCFCITVFCS